MPPEPAPDAVSPLLRASVVLIGDELLDGWVEDRNAGWLAGRLAFLGIPLDRIHIVPDEFAAIAEALGAELARTRPRVVVTSGGIGSTPDDLTMDAVARHLGLEVVSHPDITARIDAVVTSGRERGRRLDDEQVTAIHRMARVPAGSRLLAGSRGMVPGAVVDLDGGIDQPGGASVVILPGVPEQFRDIVTAAVEPELLEGRGRPRQVAEFHHGHPESAFTGVLQRLTDELPDLSIGSYPADGVVIRLKGGPADIDTALARLRAHDERLGADV